MNKVTIYTDGSYFRGADVGGWAAIIIEPSGMEMTFFGREENTTNNRMELMAAIVALSKVPEVSDVYLYRYSQYVLNGIEAWCRNWVRNGWKTQEGTEVKNADLWKMLIEEVHRHNVVNCIWVRGHNGDPMNEAVDKLAKQATGVDIKAEAEKKKAYFKSKFRPKSKYKKRFMSKAK